MSGVRASMGRRFRSVHGPALGAVSACLVLACGSGVEREQELQRSNSDLTAAGAPAAGGSCEEVLARFKSALLAEVAVRAEAARTNPYAIPPFLSEPLALPRGNVLPGVDAPAASSGRPRFSQTTPGVPGVDPGDFVKAEGDRIYLIQNTSLLVLDATDASDLKLLASVPLGEGSPTSLLVHEGRVAVLSILYEGLPGVERPLDPYGYPRYFTKLTVVDASVAAPTVVSESFFEGDTYYADRSGSVVRAFSQQYQLGLDSPPVSYVDIFGKSRSQEDIDRQIELWLELTTESIEESTVEDYLPVRFERVGGVLQSVPVSCGALLSLPLEGASVLTRSGLIALDLATPAVRPTFLPLSGVAQLATLGENSAVLVQTDYGDGNTVPTQVTSHLHLFELDGVEFSYAGSGSVPGYITGTVSVDTANDVVSVVGQRDVFGPAPGGGEGAYLRTASRVQTLQLAQGQLSPLGESADLPGDYLLASRFDGDRAYVTTYAATGFNNSTFSVVDLSDPAEPTVSTGVEIAGQGSVLVPFGSEQLLSFAQGYDPITGASTLALQLLDVSDPGAPAPGPQLALGNNSYTEALYDPRAISVHADETIFAVPVQSYETNSSSLDVFELSPVAGLTRLGSVIHDRGPFELLECLTYLGYPTDPDSLEALEASGIAESLLLDCNTYYRITPVQRGLFRGDELFALSTTRVTTHLLDQLLEPPLGSLALPEIPPFGGPVIIDVVPLPAAPSEEIASAE